MKINKIHITGNAGSGKSTLSRLLGEKTGLPVYGLDKIVWKSGWEKSPATERVERELELVQRPEWIIEGVSNRIRHAAELVIFLDRSRTTCILRCLKRNYPYLFRSRPDLPPKCPEFLILPTLLKILWQFPAVIGETIRTEATSNDKQKSYVLLRNDLEVTAFLDSYTI